MFSEAHYNNLENGNKRIKEFKKRMHKVNSILGISIAELFTISNTQLSQDNPKVYAKFNHIKMLDEFNKYLTLLHEIKDLKSFKYLKKTHELFEDRINNADKTNEFNYEIMSLILDSLTCKIYINYDISEYDACARFALFKHLEGRRSRIINNKFKFMDGWIPIKKSKNRVYHPKIKESQLYNEFIEKVSLPKSQKSLMNEKKRKHDLISS